MSSPPWDNDKTQFTIVSGSLDHPGLRTSTGNRVNVTATFPSLDSVRTLDGTWPSKSSGTLYVSFLLRLQSTNGIGSTTEGSSLITISDTDKNTPLLGINLRNDGAIRLGVLKYPSCSTSMRSSTYGRAQRLP